MATHRVRIRLSRDEPCGRRATGLGVVPLGTFILGALLLTFLVAPWQTPWDLTLLQWKLAPWSGLLATTLYGLAAITVVGWVTFRLGRPEVLAARAAAGLKRRDMRIPLAIGVSLAIGLAVAVP
ncbi:hypothetical protein PV762_02660 [Mitsuaria sp. CC2]|uniref:hypothetical protein n=1 Tax=Mitsuaria sp. CC2 TaxID=3029186 RepID=UPI003B8D2289